LLIDIHQHFNQVVFHASGETSHRRLHISADFALFLSCGASHNKKNWLFAGSERAGRRAAAIQSLFATAKLNSLDPAR